MDLPFLQERLLYVELRGHTVILHTQPGLQVRPGQVGWGCSGLLRLLYLWKEWGYQLCRGPNKVTEVREFCWILRGGEKSGSEASGCNKRSSELVF